MRIIEITTIKLSCPMDIPMADAIHHMPERATPLVHVHTDRGMTDLGEAAAYGRFVGSVEATVLGEPRQPDAIGSGGITQSRKIAAVAQAHHLPVIPHVFSSAISSVANAHVIASLPNAGPLECDQNPNPLRTDPFTDPIVIAEDGLVRLSDRTGLGVRLNQETVDRYRIDRHQP